MSRNAESRFALNPTNIDMSRSRFHRPSQVKTTFNVGDLIPFYVDEVLPGDTFNIETSKVVRMQTLVAPIMDNIYLDTYFFFVPNRLVWQHWKELMGENTQSAWVPSAQYTVPQITAPASTGWTAGTIADYMGIPTGVAGISVNALPIRAYALICNEWFRSEVLTDPLYIPVTDATVAGTNGTNYINDVAKGGMPFKAAKYHDYFTSCLPAPQKGPDVTIPSLGNAKVVTGDQFTPATGADVMTGIVGNLTASKGSALIATNEGTATGQPGKIYGSSTEQNLNTLTGRGFIPNNLYADLTSATMASINALRYAFQIQKLLEKDALGGTRYIEVIKAHFGVTSPDSRMQRPEYLGGNRIPINIHQVLSTADTTDAEIGATGAYSLTTDSHSDFTHSFTEHGFIIGVMVARYDHSYQYGLERMWTRKDRYDYYWPVLANIGNVGVRNDQIYAQGTSADAQIFGYQEAWAEYRYKPSYVTGEMRSNVNNSLDAWHLADEYSSLPVLGDTWIREDKSNVDRALMVQSSVSNQIFADIYVDNKTTRPMPFYSIPGLIDHH